MLVYQSVNWIEESQVHSFSAGRVVAEPPRRTDWAPSIRRTTRRSSTCAMSHRVAKAVGSLPLALLRFLRHLLQSRRWKLLLVGGFSNMSVWRWENDIPSGHVDRETLKTLYRSIKFGSTPFSDKPNMCLRLSESFLHSARHGSLNIVSFYACFSDWSLYIFQVSTILSMVYSCSIL
jgi:hypothetical protein